jgi:hypothetical protein
MSQAVVHVHFFPVIPSKMRIYLLELQYRDFVFRKMFERHVPSNDTRMDDIVHNVIELCRLDSTYARLHPVSYILG